MSLLLFLLFVCLFQNSLFKKLAEINLIPDQLRSLDQMSETKVSLQTWRNFRVCPSSGLLFWSVGAEEKCLHLCRMWSRRSDVKRSWWIIWGFISIRSLRDCRTSGGEWRRSWTHGTLIVSTCIHLFRLV